MKKKIPLIALAFLMVNCKYFGDSKLVDNTVDTLLIQQKERIAEDSLTIAYLRSVKSENQLQIDSLKAMLAENETYGCNKFFMIVGSFQNKEYADKWAVKIGEMGYATQVIPGRDGYNMVSAEGYNNFRKAIGDIESFRSTVVDNAWVYVKN
jgi:hypothetical protein